MKKYFPVTSVVLALLTAMYLISYIDRVNVNAAAAGFGKDFNLNNTQIGFVFSAFGYPYLAFQLIGGWVSDRFGAKRTLVICGLIWSGATILTGYATGFLSLVIARVLLGFGAGATFPAATSAMARWVPKEKRGFAQGITHAGARLGSAIAPAIVVAIMTAYTWRESFWVCGAVSLMWVAVWAWVFTEHPHDHPRITRAELDNLPEPKAKPTSIPWFRLMRRMWPVTLVYFCYGWTFWLFLSWMPLYFLNNYGMDIKKSAIFATGVFFAGVVGDTLGGIISDKILQKTGSLNKARSWMIAVCFFLSFLSLVPLLFIHAPYVAISCLAAGFFFVELTVGPFWALSMEIAPEYAGTASGTMNIGSAIAAILSPVAAGYVIDRTGNWDYPFVGSMMLILIGIAFVYRMKPHNRFIAEESHQRSR